MIRDVLISCTIVSTIYLFAANEFNIPLYLSLSITGFIGLFLSVMQVLEDWENVHWHKAVNNMGFSVIASLLCYTWYINYFSPSWFAVIVCGCAGLLGKEFILKIVNKFIENNQNVNNKG